MPGARRSPISARVAAAAAPAVFIFSISGALRIVTAKVRASPRALPERRLPIQYRFDLGYAVLVSLQQIKYFVAVAEEGHVGRAAQRLRIAQPPVSRQIRALEDEIGTALFERTPRGMRLLPSGVAFLGHARQILEAVERASAAARDARQR